MYFINLLVPTQKPALMDLRHCVAAETELTLPAGRMLPFPTVHCFSKCFSKTSVSGLGIWLCMWFGKAEATFQSNICLCP